MKDLDLFIGDNFDDVEASVISKIDVKNIDKKNIVFVQNASAQSVYLKKILNVLKVKSILNVEVTTISAFLKNNALLSESDKIMSAMEQQLMVKNAILSVKNDKLKIFNQNITNGLIENVTNEIIRFEQSEISLQQLKTQNVQNEMLKNKLDDLALIYERYLELLDGKFDNQNIFSCIDKLKNKLGEYNFYFVGFLHLNKNELTFLKHIALNSKSCAFGLCDGKNNENNYIFNLELKNNILQLKDEQLKVNVFEVKNNQDLNHKLLGENLFSVASGNNDKPLSNFIKIYEAIDAKTEIENVARIIKKIMVETNAVQGDFAILCSDIQKYKNEIENVFGDYNFETYFDCGYSLKEFPITIFCENVFEYFVTKDVANFENIALSDFSNLTKNEKNELLEFKQKNEIKTVEDYLRNKTLLNCVSALKEILIESETKNEPLNAIDVVFEKLKIEEKIKNILQNCLKLEYDEKIKLNKKIIEKIKNVCEKIKNNYLLQFSWLNFVEDFKFYVEKTSLKNNIQFLNTIFVGGMHSEILRPKYLFVIGANEGALPEQNNDTAILTDENLKALGNDFKNVFQVKEQNRISRLNVFKQLTNFENSIFISYSLTDSSGQKLLPCGFIESLNNFSDKNLITNLMHLGGKELDEKSLKEKANYWAKILGTARNAKIEVLKNKLSQNYDLCELIPSIEKAINFDEEKNENEPDVQNIQKLCFGEENKTQISQIETYYACPFKHFISYGLKLREVEDCKLKNNHFGKFLHKVAELLFRQEYDYLNKFSNGESLEKRLEEIFEKIKLDKKFEKFFFDSNKYALNILKTECKRFCEHLLLASQKSAYKPKYLEVFFGEEKNKFEISVLNQDFSLVGVVDRVDVCDDCNIVVDYKTSDSTKGNSNELFYGEKVQIFVYAKALQKVLGLNPQGVFYMPILNKFDEEKKEPYKLRGKYVEDLNFVLKMDTTLSIDNPKSTIFDCVVSTSKEAMASSELKLNASKQRVAKEEFEDMMDYSIKMVESAIKEILQGSFVVSPKEGACENCEFLSICQKKASVVERKHEFEINDKTFTTIKGENKGENDGN